LNWFNEQLLIFVATVSWRNKKSEQNETLHLERCGHLRQNRTPYYHTWPGRRPVNWSQL